MFRIFYIRLLCLAGMGVLLWVTPARSEAEGAPQNQPAASSQDDRKSGASKASAMALAQAAMAQVMCLKMMADAQKENDSEKMAMAAAMCAQAAALAANGKENEEGSKKSSSPPPMGAVPTFEKAKIETEPKPDDLDLPSTEINKPSTIQLSQTPTPSLEKEKPVSDGSVFQEDKTFQNRAMGAPIEGSKDVDSSSIALRNGGNPQNFATAGSSLGGNNNSPNNPLANSSLSQISPQTGLSLEESKSTNKKPGKISSSGGGDAGSGFDDLMARYMGGMSGGGGLSAGPNGGMIDLAYGLQKPGQKQRNIFEFASDQYKQASRQRSLKPKPIQAPLILRGLTSQ